MKDRYTPEQRREYMRRYYLSRLKEAKALLGNKCARCDETENLEFDHINPNTKIAAITSMLMWARHEWIIELRKCQLLCSTHHKIKTREDIDAGLTITGGSMHITKD